jgi:hypothetical protein
MNEPRETANADIHQTISGLVGDIASGRAEETRSFAQKNSQGEFFCAKEKSVPCCRRRFCRSPGETPGLMNDRVTSVNYEPAHPVQPKVTSSASRCATSAVRFFIGCFCSIMPRVSNRYLFPQTRHRQ